MVEVVQTVIELKNYPHLVLRITNDNARLEGRISFSHGGYILGGRINNTDDTGYKAIKELLSVKEGNYAILDPGPQQISDINQTLWLISDLVMKRLPDLPDTPVEFFDKEHTHEEPPAAAPVFTEMAYGRPDQKAADNANKSTISSKKGRARSFNASFWYFLQWLCVVVFSVAIAAAFAAMWNFYGKTPTAPPKNSSQREAKH